MSKSQRKGRPESHQISNIRKFTLEDVALAYLSLSGLVIGFRYA